MVGVVSYSMKVWKRALAEWIYYRRARDLRVSWKLVCAKAKKIFHDIVPERDPRDFVASRGGLVTDVYKETFVIIPNQNHADSEGS